MRKVCLAFFLILYAPSFICGQNDVFDVRKQLSEKSEEVLVVSHRGDWRNAPENSLQAIQNCIDMNFLIFKEIV